MRREVAESALKMIRSNMTIGLGEGRMVEYLIEFIQYANMDVKVVTSSINTAMLCKKHQLTVVPTWSTDSIDIAFDECDQVDTDLNGMKSNKNLKVQDKIIASMAKQFVLMVDAKNFVESFSFDFPVVVSVIFEGFSYVKKKLEELGAQVTWKDAVKEDAYFSQHGNIMMEASFDHVEDAAKLNEAIMNIPGVVDTSLFMNVATNAIVGSDNEVKLINK